MTNHLLCPVCGYKQDKPPWKDGCGGSQEICACCGIQFGYDDATRDDHRGPIETYPRYLELRAKWVANGMQFWSQRKQPAEYDPIKQLESIGVMV